MGLVSCCSCSLSPGACTLQNTQQPALHVTVFSPLTVLFSVVSLRIVLKTSVFVQDSEIRLWLDSSVVFAQLNTFLKQNHKMKSEGYHFYHLFVGLHCIYWKCWLLPIFKRFCKGACLFDPKCAFMFCAFSDPVFRSISYQPRENEQKLNAWVIICWKDLVFSFLLCFSEWFLFCRDLRFLLVNIRINVQLSPFAVLSTGKYNAAPACTL